MTSATFVLLSSMLSLGLPLALAIFELRSLRRPSSDGDGRPPPSPLPLSPKPLPDCLLPRPVAISERRPARALENA